jgi:hypothetical protein
MKPTPDKIAADWIAYARYDPNKAPEEVYLSGWVIYDLAVDDPTLAWEAIKLVVYSYSEDELFAKSDNEANNIVGNTAAGPLEDLLANHGPQFIEAVELAARIDRRIMWALGGVWQNSMTDEIWARVQIAAGEFRGR